MPTQRGRGFTGHHRWVFGLVLLLTPGCASATATMATDTPTGSATTTGPSGPMSVESADVAVVPHGPSEVSSSAVVVSTLPPASSPAPAAAAPSVPPGQMNPPTGPTVPTAGVSPATALPVPVGIRIPSIELDEPLIDLGVNADGTAEVPTAWDDAGWFTPGGRPGTVGPTVLIGHVDSKSGPAVFYRLPELAAGAEIVLTVADGTTATYRVTAIDQYAKDVFPTFEVFGATLDDVLRLVTCGGTFDRSAGHYRDNVVVTADRVR